MNRILTCLFLTSGLLGSLTLIGVQTKAACPIANAIAIHADTSQHAFKPDNDFVQAVARNDQAAVGKLLDDDFTWTDARGRTFTRAQIVENLPTPALGMENQVDKRELVDRKIAIHRAARGNIYVLRVWVKRGTSWRLLVYQEVSQLAAATTTETGGEENRENPCKTVPFEPKNDAERDIIQAYQQVEQAVTLDDSAAWGSHIADEFFAVTSNSDRPMDKQNRMAGLDRQKQGGIAPFPLVSARMFEFGDMMVMTSIQQPDQGKPIHVTRIWIKQQGKWLEVFSYQTTIQ
jgi:hypothetical protein